MRDENALLALRPEIAGLHSDHSTPAERFQNMTLRPILKFQHELLVLLIADLPHLESLRSSSKSEDVFKAKVIELLKQQSDVKNQLIGLIAGHLTADEWSHYREMKSELNKRIIQMIGERVAGVLWM